MNNTLGSTSIARIEENIKRVVVVWGGVSRKGMENIWKIAGF